MQSASWVKWAWQPDLLSLRFWRLLIRGTVVGLTQ